MTGDRDDYHALPPACCRMIERVLPPELSDDLIVSYSDRLTGNGKAPTMLRAVTFTGEAILRFAGARAADLVADVYRRPELLLAGAASAHAAGATFLRKHERSIDYLANCGLYAVGLGACHYVIQWAKPTNMRDAGLLSDLIFHPAAPITVALVALLVLFSRTAERRLEFRPFGYAGCILSGLMDGVGVWVALAAGGLVFALGVERGLISPDILPDLPPVAALILLIAWVVFTATMIFRHSRRFAQGYAAKRM